ncbi:MAG: hypothetical protein HQ541_13720 [Mariniphaga sp.]|nr:hypothetical protein [Mariniphaga sp.]
MKKLYLLLGILYLVCSCTSSKKLNTNKYSLEIHFGNSGGFTNSQTEYVLNKNGKLNMIVNNNETEITILEKSTIRKIKKLLKSLDFENLIIDDPGNMTYFIKVKTTDFENSAKWNDNTKNQQLKNFYNLLMETVRKFKS